MGDANVTAKKTASEILNSALLRLKGQRSQISIRSIAAQLEVSPSYLSKVFRGERTISSSLLAGLIRTLQLDHLEVAELQRRLLQSFDEKKLAARTGIRTMSPATSTTFDSDYSRLGHADFWLLEEWYHLPILNLATTENFDADPKVVAKRLGISTTQAERTLQTLINSGYLEKDQLGAVKRTEVKLRFPTQRSHTIVRRHHHKMGGKALELLKDAPSEQEFGERLISGITFACDPTKIEEAKVMIEEALYKAAELMASGNCTEVFQMNLQLFKLTRKP